MLATAWKTVVKLALQEDIGCGDITSNAIFTGKETGCARITVDKVKLTWSVHKQEQYSLDRKSVV